MKVYQTFLLGAVLLSIVFTQANFLNYGANGFNSNYLPQAGSLQGFNNFGLPNTNNFASPVYQPNYLNNFQPNYQINNINPNYQNNNVNPNYQSCVAAYNLNLIQNGDFEKNACSPGTAWCGWNQSDIRPEYVPGWQSIIGGIQIGNGSYYNSRMQSTWVTSLDNYINTCVRQKVFPRQGKYTLSFDWAANMYVSASDSKFDIKFNNQVIRTIVPTDLQQHREVFDFYPKCTSPAYIEFCGTGPSDAFGPVVDNIKLVYSDVC